MKLKKVMILAAHPDDDVLGCGGLMAKYSLSDVEFKVVFLGEGSTCRYEENTVHSNEAQEEISQRNQCGVNALGVLNVDNHTFYNIPCGRFDTVPIIDIGKIIESEIKTFQPDTIFTHSGLDVNNDHQAAFQATLQATRPGVQNFVSRVYSYEVSSSSEWRFSEVFKPTSFVELTSENMQKKMNALYEYPSELRDFPFPRSKTGIYTLAKYRGMQIGVKYAESYQLVREILE